MSKEEILKELGFTKVGSDTLWRNGSMAIYIDLSSYKDNESITRAIFFSGTCHKANEIKQALRIGMK